MFALDVVNGPEGFVIVHVRQWIGLDFCGQESLGCDGSFWLHCGGELHTHKALERVKSRVDLAASRRPATRPKDPVFPSDMHHGRGHCHSSQSMLCLGRAAGVGSLSTAVLRRQGLCGGQAEGA